MLAPFLLTEVKMEDGKPFLLLLRHLMNCEKKDLVFHQMPFRMATCSSVVLTLCRLDLTGQKW